MSNFIVIPQIDNDNQASYLKKNFLSHPSTGQAHNSVVMGTGGPLSSIESASSVKRDQTGQNSTMMGFHPLTAYNHFQSSTANNSMSVNQSQIANKFETPKYPTIY